MCGIFGVFSAKDSGYPPKLMRKLTTNLFILSESRGKDAAGIAVITTQELFIYKEPVCASVLVKKIKYKELMNRVFGGFTAKPIAILGQARLATNGQQQDNNNNCPLVSGVVIGVHNGIVVNDTELNDMFKLGTRRGSADSETLFNLLEFFISKPEFSLASAVQSTFRYIEGSASLAAFIAQRNRVLLATNKGSIYYCTNIKRDIFFFASELIMLQEIIKKLKLVKFIGQYCISQLQPNQAVLINTLNFSEERVTLNLLSDSDIHREGVAKTQ